MAETISDRQVVLALRPFVRAAGPVLDALRETDLFGLRNRNLDPGHKHNNPEQADPEQSGHEELAEVEPGLREKLLNGLASIKVPGTSAWASMDVDERTRWWLNRVGRFAALLTAVPGLGGALADRLPVQDAIGAASQGLLLCAVAGEHGVQDVGDRVRLIAWVLFDREIDPIVADGGKPGHEGFAQDRAAEDVETAELTEEMSAATKKNGRVSIKACVRTLWRLGRSLLAITAELEKRPSGRFYHRALGMIPVVGMASDYFGERSGLKRVIKRADKWFARQ